MREMASELLHHSTDNFTPFWQNNKPYVRHQSYGCPNVQSDLPKKSRMGRTRPIPHFLRLDSTGESAESSPEPEESLGGCQKRKQTSWDTSKRRFRASNNGAQREVAAKSRRTANSFQFQGNNFSHSKESLGSFELDLLASKFNSCSTNQETAVRTSDANCQGNMSRCFNNVYNQDNSPRLPTSLEGDRYPPHNMRPFPGVGPPDDSQQAQNEAALSFINMAVFRPNFIHQPFQKLHHLGPFPSRPPLVPPPMGFSNSPFYQMPRGPVPPPPNFNFFPHRAQFPPFRFHQQQMPHAQVKEQFKHPYSANRKKNSHRERTHPKMFTKILQRPPQKEASEKQCSPSCDAADTSLSAKQPAVGAGSDTSEATAEGCTSSPGTAKRCSLANCSGSVETVEDRNDSKVAGNPDTTENDIERKSGPGNMGADGAKQRHSSIEFLLGSLKSGDRLSDSDFVDCDWDTVDNSDDHTWEEYFLGNDPYNPLTGWRCQKGCPQATEEVDKTDSKPSSSPWSHRSQDFDSGTESGSEGETNSESEGDWEEEGESEEVSSRDDSQIGAVHSSTKVMDEAEGCKTISGQGQSIPEESSSKDETDAAKRQKCLHPSISYVLGGYSAASEDSEDESDDWDSFEDSDDESNRPDQSSLFQFSNNRFPPLAYFLRSPLAAPETKSSPSVPCGPIFKPKARTVLISQRIICQVADHPVSMIVPLEHSGRMSQNSMPTIQVGGQSSPKVTFPVSCLKAPCGRGEKKSKKVHFNNKAMLVVCPEPSHLVEEIKNTRRGPWLDYARDRCRFQHRIQHLQRVIGPCLSPEHRKKVWERIQQPTATS